VQAAICYIETELTLNDTADLFDKTGMSIRPVVNQIIDHGVVTLEYIRENNVDNGLQMFGEKRYQGEKSPNLKP